jgi:hypothetical protein
MPGRDVAGDNQGAVHFKLGGERFTGAPSQLRADVYEHQP